MAVATRRSLQNWPWTQNLLYTTAVEEEIAGHTVAILLLCGHANLFTGTENINVVNIVCAVLERKFESQSFVRNKARFL